MAERRLPLYLLLDCSGSMAGEPIEAVRQGIRSLLSDLKGDPMALETAYLSIITFGSTARQLQPLTEIGKFQEPSISAGGGRALGAALRLLRESIKTEIKRPTEAQKSDWKPLVFLMMVGPPTDSWQHEAEELKNARLGNIIVCAACPGVEASMLAQITETVVHLNDLQPDVLKNFFKWVSISTKTTSQGIGQVSSDTPINLPQTPPQIQIVP